MTYGYQDALARRAADAGPVTLAGSSGYFAARGSTLDPSLFQQGDHLRPDVRLLILSKLYGFWAPRYRDARSWSTVWIAGSGATTAWSADREAGGAPGDLDVLVGIEWGAFFQANPHFQGSAPADVAKYINDEMHAGLWPETDHQMINGTTYELTFYVNPTGSNIRDINPYAAYDVSHDEWTVHPVQVDANFGPDYFTAGDRAIVDADLRQARQIAGDYNGELARLQSAPRGSAEYVNSAARLHGIVRAGAGLFDSIHDGRRDAFSADGKGYFDVANYRWQAGKGNGAITVSRQLKQVDEQAHKEAGLDCGSTGHLLLLAALVNGGG